jgi:hypothetical protein
MRDSQADAPRSLYPLPGTIAPLDAVRGTILALDWRALREAEVFDAYQAAIEAGARDALLGSTAGSWVPMALIHAHYRALDALDLDEERIRRIGWSVGDGAHGAFLQTLIRLAGALGVTPWLALEQCHKLWIRTWRGGAIAVHRLSPHDARVSLVKVGVCGSRFFRHSFGGALCAGIAPFCRTRSATVIGGSVSEHGVAFRVSWV